MDDYFYREEKMASESTTITRVPHPLDFSLGLYERPVCVMASQSPDLSLGCHNLPI
jgi:hypothetical protein